MTDPRTVFVVDDDEASAASVAALMRAIGLACQVYASAEEFMETFDHSHDGCLILDVQLPGMNGLDVTRNLRDAGAEIPIILVSGMTDDEAQQQAMDQSVFA